jgi:hypothetical protein
LRRAAEFIAARVRRYAPTAKSAESFRINRRLDAYYITSHDDGTIMTETNKRHMLFGDRDGQWWNENVNHPERTHFMEKAAEDAAQDAAERFANDWAEGVVASSSILERAR